jgi:hypothetical protein
MGEGAPYREDEVTVKQKIKIWLWAPLGARHQDELADRPLGAMRLEIELASLHCKLQTRPLVRVGALHEK